MKDRKDDPKKEESPLETVNRYFVENTKRGQPTFTVEGIAKKLGIDEETLNDWTQRDSEFVEGITRFNRIQELGIFEHDEFGISNRADAMVIAMLILETKHRNDLGRS